jgi:hypothetical protein
MSAPSYFQNRLETNHSSYTISQRRMTPSAMLWSPCWEDWVKLSSIRPPLPQQERPSIFFGWSSSRAAALLSIYLFLVSVATTPDRVWSVLLKHASVLLFTVVKWFDWIVISDFMHPSYHLTAAAYPAGCMLVAHRLYLWAGGVFISLCQPVIEIKTYGPTPSVLQYIISEEKIKATGRGRRTIPS